MSALSVNVLSIKLFGPVRIAYAESPLPNVTSPKIHALIAYLAVEPARAYPRAELAELLWPDRSPGIARQNLRQTLTRLNRGVNQADSKIPLLAITRNTIELNHDAVRIDAVQLIRLLDQVKAHAHASTQSCQPCCEKLAEAVALFQSDFLAGLDADSPAFDDWLRPKQAWFRRGTSSALITLVEHHLANQDEEAAYQFALRYVELDPWSDVAQRQLMRTLAQVGKKAEALAQFEHFRQTLVNELSAEPALETVALRDEIQRMAEQQDAVPILPKPVDVKAPALRNFPVAATTFVGREGELTELRSLLANQDCRLITLLGYGGIGKTRLAIEVGKAHVAQFSDGATFIELTAVTSADHLPAAIAHGLGMSFSRKVESVPQQRAELLAFLAQKEMLLILDNMEQFLSDQVMAEQRESLAALISDIIQSAPGSKLLVTSRQPLHLRAEWIFDVEGLNYPAPNPASSASNVDSPAPTLAFEQFEAMQLFAHGMQRTNRRFQPTETDAQAIVEICQVVEGTPLALELAASWGRQLSCLEICDRIVQSLDFLATTMYDVPPRHRSIRAVFESTWHTLNPALQQIYARLSVLRGAFSAEAAKAVAAADEDALIALLDQSLLRRATVYRGEERFEVHELLRQYAMEKLAAHPTVLEQTQQELIVYFANYVAAHDEALNGAEVDVGVDAVQEQIANIRAVWQRAIALGAAHQIGLLASGLQRYFTMTNQTEEALASFGTAIKTLRISEEPQAKPVLAQLLAHRARAFYKIARYPEAVLHAEEAQALGADVGAERAEVLGALYWGISLINQGKQGEAREKLSETLNLSRRSSWPKIESDALRALGILAQQTGDIDAAKVYYEDSLAIGQQIDDARGTSACLGNLGNIYRHNGDFERAQTYMNQSLAIHQRIGDRSSEARTISMLGDLAVDLEEYPEAENCFQKAYEILTEIGEHHYAADALVSLGECYARLGETEKATPLWERALAQYQEAGEMAQVEMVMRYLDSTVSSKKSALSKR